MAEWHLAPEYIIGNWTDEEFALMCEKLMKRKRREAEMLKVEPEVSRRSSSRLIPDSELFRKMGSLVEVKRN